MCAFPSIVRPHSFFPITAHDVEEWYMTKESYRPKSLNRAANSHVRDQVETSMWRLLLDILAKDRLVPSVLEFEMQRECAASVTTVDVKCGSSPRRKLLLTEACDSPGCRCTRLLYSTPRLEGDRTPPSRRNPFSIAYVRRGCSIVRVANYCLDGLTEGRKLCWLLLISHLNFTSRETV